MLPHRQMRNWLHITWPKQSKRSSAWPIQTQNTIEDSSAKPSRPSTTSTLINEPTSKPGFPCARRFCAVNRKNYGMANTVCAFWVRASYALRANSDREPGLAPAGSVPARLVERSFDLVFNVDGNGMISPQPTHHFWQYHTAGLQAVHSDAP